jgi:transposase
MIKSVGIDLAGAGEHKVRCLDERAQMCDGFSFETTKEGLAKLEERVFSNGSNSVIVFEPTGLAWLLVAVYLKARHPDSRLVRVQAQKVVALRKYLHRSSKRDKIDSLTLAKMHIIVAVGRKLLSALYAMLKRGMAYDPNWEENSRPSLARH